MASTISLQNVVDSVIVFGDIEPVLNSGGYSDQPARTIATDVANAMLADNFPYKWNQFDLPDIFTNSWQQDYALLGPDGLTSVTNLSWLQEGVAINVNASSIPKPYAYVEVGRSQGKSTSSLFSNNTFSGPIFTATFLPNSLLYFGTWGSPNVGGVTLGNNPQPNQVITSPIGARSQPNNPITQIVDGQGNLMVLSTYGTTGESAPELGAGTAPGTPVADGSCVWVVVDPNGQGIRISPVPSQTGTVWQIQLVGQMIPPTFTSLAQTLYPIPDDYEPNFRAGFIAQCYRYSPEAKVRAKFTDEWGLWLKALRESRFKSDRERDERNFIPQKVIGAGASGGGYLGGAYPFAGPAGRY